MKKQKNRKRIILCSVCVLCMFLLAACGSQTNSSAKILSKQEEKWIQDIDGDLRKQLNQAAGINEKMSKVERDKRLDEIIIAIREESIDDNEISYRLRELISDFGIAHIELGSPYQYLKGCEVYPVIGNWYGDSYYIIEVAKEYKDCLGGVLTAVNGYPMDEVMATYERIYSNETDGWAKHKFEQYNYKGLIKSDLSYLGLLKDDEISVTIAKDGVLYEKLIKPMEVEKQEGNINLYSQLFTDIEKVPFGDKVRIKSEYAPFTFEHDKDNSIIYFQYNECADNTLEGCEDYPNFKVFFSEMITYMKAHETEYECLVIDLRNNTGGSELYINDAVDEYHDFLAQQNIKLLIGKRTFSAGQDAIDTILEAFPDTKLYGEETGLAIHNYTSVNKYTLKNTGCNIGITRHEDYVRVLDDRQKDLTRGVIPDVEVAMSFEDYIKGIDSVYQKVIETK